MNGMEIDFNPNAVSGPRTSSPVKGPSIPATPESSPAPQGMAELQRKLNELALTRPEKMQGAAQALSDVKYPPEQLLNGIAHLLGIHLSE
jgi:hypothetical protein